MNATRRILLLSMKAGNGHIRAAQAVEFALGYRHPGCEIRHWEVLEHATALFRGVFNGVYFPMIRWTPGLWRRIYEGTEHSGGGSVLHRLSGFVNGLNLRRLLRDIATFDPDAIVCTHFIPAQVVAALKRQGLCRAELSVVMTDYAAHGMWIHPGVDRYFVATDRMADEVRRIDSAARVEVTGIPIHSVFSRGALDKRDSRARLGLDPDVPVLLATSGGGGLGALEATARRLSDAFPRARIAAVAGHNRDLLDALRALAEGRSNITPCGFVNNMQDWMAASELVVSKPGGLTCSECLAMGLPMILVDPIPGQEERNAAAMAAFGAARMASQESEIVEAARAVLERPEAASRMRLAAVRASRPHAAAAIADALLGPPARCLELPLERTVAVSSAQTI